MKKSTPINESNVFNDFTVLEINEDKKVVGRKNITMSFHEIHALPEQTNLNNIHWKEEYVLANQHTAKEMPIVVSYLDKDRDVVSGHGDLAIDPETNEAYFENSEVVGVINETFITEINVDGTNKKVFGGKGYLYTQRHINFSKFLNEQIEQGTTIQGSVEVAVRQYETGEAPNYRVPKDYDYTGMAILFTEQPSDKASVLLELNQTQETNVLDINEVKENDSKERSNTMENLQVEVQAEETKIAELNTQIAVLNAKIVELNSTVETNNVSTEELNAKIANLESELNKYKEAELAQAREAMVAEFNSKLDKYSDSQKEVAKAKIETFTAEPSESLAQEIVNEINAKIVEELLNAPAKEEEIVETNSTEEELDIYSAVIDNKQEATDDVAIY
jgi:outer membrane murein-binding lipoprotein Lpp